MGPEGPLSPSGQRRPVLWSLQDPTSVSRDPREVLEYPIFDPFWTHFRPRFGVPNGPFRDQYPGPIRGGHLGSQEPQSALKGLTVH